jgi:hypothetical protein
MTGRLAATLTEHPEGEDRDAWTDEALAAIIADLSVMDERGQTPSAPGAQ